MIIEGYRHKGLELDIEFPYEKMHLEAKAIKEMFVKHRDSDSGGGYRHAYKTFNHI